MITETRKSAKSKKTKAKQRQAQKQIVKVVRKVYPHVSENGDELYCQILRYELTEFNTQKFGCRRPDPKSPPDLDNPADANDPDDKIHWIYDMEGVRRVPYRLPEFLRAIKDRPDEPVFLTPSHHDTDRCWDHGFIATNFAFGEKASWKEENNSWFEPVRLIVLPVHNDSTGKEWGLIVASSFKSEIQDYIVKILELPGLEEHGDIADWFDQGGTKQELLALLEGIRPMTKASAPKEADGQFEEKDHEKPCDLLMKLCSDIELFHDDYGNGYARVPVGNHKETFSLSSKSFSIWLTGRYYSQYEDVPRKQTLSDTIAALEGQARFDSPGKFVFVRIAAHEGKVYLDMGDPDWRAVEIDASGWRIITNSPVTFKRPGSLGVLPEPVPGGSIDLLKPFINIENPEDWTLLVGWILGAFQTEGPYPILSITGEQGSAKSTVCRLIQDLIDPSKAKLRSLPRSDHDLMLAAINNRLLAFDNVSVIPTWISDALCRLSTWSAFSTRTLYSNDEETVLSKQCPIILNGIVEAANRSDLLDRMICLCLKPIKDQDRLTERVLFEAFERDKPHIFGAILDGVSSALRDFDRVKLPNPPRMADFACWAVAGLPGLNLSMDDFLTAYASNRQTVNRLALEGSSLAETLQSFISERFVWQGTSSQLYEKLNALIPDKLRDNKKFWPSTPVVLSKQLRRLAPNLRRIGIEINFDLRAINKKRTRLLEIQFYPDVGVNLGKDGC